MDMHKRSLGVGAAALGVAILIKLCTLAAQPLQDFFLGDWFSAALLYLETGRTPAAAPAVPPETTLPPATEPPPQTTDPILPAAPVFSPDDSALVCVTPLAGYRVDVKAMLASPLSLQLRQAQPTVLILHSHATESYTPTQAEPYTPSGSYRTLDDAHNMLRVGDRLQALLENAGIGVIHDRTLHDYPDFNNAYAASRATAQKYLSRYPSIQLVLDLHRDAADTAPNTQLTTHAAVNGKSSAQLMFVIGTDGTGLTHPHWQENMSLAVKLQAVLEKKHPGICRSVNLRGERFNQDLSPGAMIVEVGAAGDTLEKALVAIEALAEGILALTPTANYAS